LFIKYLQYDLTVELIYDVFTEGAGRFVELRFLLDSALSLAVFPVNLPRFNYKTYCYAKLIKMFVA